MGPEQTRSPLTLLRIKQLYHSSRLILRPKPGCRLSYSTISPGSANLIYTKIDFYITLWRPLKKTDRVYQIRKNEFCNQVLLRQSKAIRVTYNNISNDKKILKRNSMKQNKKKNLKDSLSTIVEVLSLLATLIGLFI